MLHEDKCCAGMLSSTVQGLMPYTPPHQTGLVQRVLVLLKIILTKKGTLNPGGCILKKTRAWQGTIKTVTTKKVNQHCIKLHTARTKDVNCSRYCSTNHLWVCVRVFTWVASAISAIPYTCAQHYSSTVAPACFMGRATLLRYWVK